MVQICADRECKKVLATVEGKACASPTDPLPIGPVYWRAYGISDNLIGATPSAMWVAYVRGNQSKIDTRWGHMPDFTLGGRAAYVLLSKTNQLLLREINRDHIDLSATNGHRRFSRADSHARRY